MTMPRKHRHNKSCYRLVRKCSRMEHQHTSSCFKEEVNGKGKVKKKRLCRFRFQHTHSKKCYKKVLNCTANPQKFR